MAEDRETLIDELKTVARKGRVEDVSKLSAVFSDDVGVLGEALVRACVYDQLSVVKWLVKHTALRDDIKGLSEALRTACDHGRQKVIRWMVKRTADSRVLNVALGWAHVNRKRDMVKLIENNAETDVNSAD